MEPFFFDDWVGLARTALAGVMAYITLVVILRVGGKRTLSKMNAFDFVVTIAIGSTLATIQLNQDVTIAEGTVALLTLVGLQFAITWTSVRYPRIKKWSTGRPALVLYKGLCIPDALRKERVTEPDILAAVRQAGLYSLSDALAVVLETDGSFSVVKQGESVGQSSMKDVIVLGKSGESSGRHAMDSVRGTAS